MEPAVKQACFSVFDKFYFYFFFFFTSSESLFIYLKCPIVTLKGCAILNVHYFNLNIDSEECRSFLLLLIINVAHTYKTCLQSCFSDMAELASSHNNIRNYVLQILTLRILTAFLQGLVFPFHFLFFLFSVICVP